MARGVTIAARLRELFLDGRWIANTNYTEQLTGLSWEYATQQVSHLNTIAALTFHINYYLDGLLKAFAHNKLEIRDQYSFDVPVINSQDGWDKLVKELLRNATEFASLVERMNDARFDEAFIEEKYGTVLRNVEGVLEHSYYHFGQIVIIRKMILEGSER